jgi:hypothetical protein
MTEPTQAPPKPTERAPQVAVAPLNTIAEQDVGVAAAAFDKWLRKISHDYVTLERLSTVAGSLPVIGNIMALIDAIMDVVEVIQKTIAKKEVDFLQWVSLGINLIGVVPLPAMSAARMSLRPALHLVRQKLALGVKDIGAALTEVLIAPRLGMASPPLPTTQWGGALPSIARRWKVRRSGNPSKPCTAGMATRWRWKAACTKAMRPASGPCTICTSATASCRWCRQPDTTDFNWRPRPM